MITLWQRPRASRTVACLPCQAVARDLGAADSQLWVARLAGLAIGLPQSPRLLGGGELTAIEQVISPAPGPELVAITDQTTKPNWTRAYIRRLAVTDAAAIVASVATAELVRFGADPARLHSQMSQYSYTLVSMIFVVAWFAALSVFRSWDLEPSAMAWRKSTRSACFHCIVRGNRHWGLPFEALRGAWLPCRCATAWLVHVIAWPLVVA